MSGLVVNIHLDPYDIYIGRKSIWGNPYSSKPSQVPGTTRVTSKQEALDMYEKYIRGQPELLKQLPVLKGKILGCFCAPKGGITLDHAVICHGQILLKLLKELENE